MSKKKGDWGEQVALLFLRKKGFNLVAQNWRAHHIGEIDLIVCKKDKVTFVEVKARANNQFGYGLEAMDDYKINKLFATAEVFLLENQQFSNFIWQLDLIEVIIERDEGVARVSWFPNIGS